MVGAAVGCGLGMYEFFSEQPLADWWVGFFCFREMSWACHAMAHWRRKLEMRLGKIHILL
jgi:hypothetical protein